MKRQPSLALLGILASIVLLSCEKEEPVGPTPDRTPPPPVTNLTVTQQPLGLYLDWDMPLLDGQPVPDLKEYRVRRDPPFGVGRAHGPAAETADDYVVARESFYLDRSVAEGRVYVYTVTAVDDSLNESTPVSTEPVVFDTRAPLVVITFPPTGFVTNQTLVQVRGTVVDSQTVATATVFVNGAALAQVPVVTGFFSTQVSLSPGLNVIRAQATDPSGNVGVSADVSVLVDTSPVVVVIQQPVDGLITRESRIAVAGTVSDPGITTATLIVNETQTTIAVANGQFAGTAVLQEGANVIRVTATNQAGTSGDSGPVTVTRDTQAPQVTIVQPLDNTPFQDTPIFVSGTVTDANPPDSVTLTVSGQARNIPLASGQFQAWAQLGEGANQIVVSATDRAGNTGSASVTVYLNSQGPTVRITTPADGALLNTRSVDVGGTVSDPAIASGTLFVDGVPQIITIQNGIFLVTATVGSDGLHRFWVEVVDQYGRPGVSNTVSITVDTTPPHLVITSPEDGSVGNSPSISVAGQIDDLEVSVVTVVVNGFGTQVTPYNGVFAAQVTLREGWNAIAARATDVAGNTGLSDTTRVLLDTQAAIREVGHDAAGRILQPGDQVLFWVDAGEAGGTASVDIGTVHPGIGLYDDGTHGDNLASDGIYKVRYTVQASDEVVQAQVIGHFTDRVGNVALPQAAAAPITINAPPPPVTLAQPGWTDVTSRAVRLRWTASTIPDFKDYRLYRKTSPNVDTLSTLVATITTIGADSVVYTDRDPSLVHGTRYYYKVFVRDAFGAVAGSNEVNAVIDSWPTEQTLIIPTGDNPCYMSLLDGPAGRCVVLSHLSIPGKIRVLNMSTNSVIKDLDVPGMTVGTTSNPYIESLVAGFDDGKIYRVHGTHLAFTEPPVHVGGHPWDVGCAWGPGDTLYAFTTGRGDSIAVINLYTGYVDARFGTGGVLYSHWGSSPDFGSIYAGSPSGIIARIDPMNWRISQTWPGFRGIFDMTVTQDYIFLCHHDDSRVTVIRRWDMQVQRELFVGARPAQCLLLPGGRYLYVACKLDNVVKVYDTQTWQEIDRIPVALPVGLLSDQTGNKLYVTRLAYQGGVVVIEY